MSDEQQFRPPSSLKGRTFRDVESEVQSESTIEPACKQRRKLPVIALVLFMVLTLGVGTAMIFAGSQETVQNVPLPEVPDLVVPVDQEPVGMDGVEPPAAPESDQEVSAEQQDQPVPEAAEGAYSGAVPVENADTGGGEAGWNNPNSTVPLTLMSTDLMEPLSVFVPEAKLYSLAKPSGEFEESKYEGMTSILIPDNPRRTVWHSEGGLMAGGETGTTFLGSHSGYAGAWGAYINMAYLAGGETVWTKDDRGELQRWQVDRIRSMHHTEFPQEYWDADGDRRLVLATCGGEVGADGLYAQNVFVEAKPVQLDGSAL